MRHKIVLLLAAICCSAMLWAEDDFATLLQKAQNGDASAQVNVGYRYEKGNGVSKDYTKAVYWYRKAAEQGDRVAQYDLGIMYENGYGVSQDYTQAVYWYHKAAEQGDADAQYNLGLLYHNGRGVDKDYSEAKYWYSKAAEQGYSNAQNNIGVLYEFGRGVKQDYSIAMLWYKKAMEQGNERAKNNYNSLAAKGYKPAPEKTTRPADPPLLVLEDNSFAFTDETNNNRIDAEETCAIRFRVANRGKGAAMNCEARVTLSGNTAGISTQKVPLPTIAAGKTQEVSIPLTSTIQTENGSVTITIEVYEPKGWGVAPFDLTVATKAFEQPLLQVVDYALTSPSGTIRKMEPFTLSFNLQNTQYGDAEQVTVKIKLPTNVYIMDGSAEHSFPRIQSGEVKAIRLTLAANNNYATADIPVTIDVKEKHGQFAQNKDLRIALNSATVSKNFNIAAKEEPREEKKEIKLALMTAEVDRNIPVSKTKNTNTFVLIIANENYQSLAPVPFALNDGSIFRQYCEQTLGIPAKNIHEQRNATGNQIKAQINWLKNVVEVFDQPNIIFYYAGHGMPDEKTLTAYLLPVDGIATDLTTGYKLDDLYATLGTMPAARVMVFMDACFSGTKREDGMLIAARGVARESQAATPRGNMVVFSAAQGDETAYPDKEKKHGLFTYYLLKKLQETEGNVTLQELGDYIITNVKQQSVLMNAKLQTPSVSPSRSMDADWQNWKLK